MVATMTNLAFVLDQVRVEYKDLTPTEWVTIINEAKGLLTLEYLKGLKSLRQILEKTDDGSFRRLLKPYTINNALLEGIKPNTVFCHLVDVNGPPLSKRSFTFDEVPCEKYPNLTDKIARPYYQAALLLGRRGEFYLLEAQWELKEGERDVGRTFPSYDYWCELLSMRLDVLWNAELEVLFLCDPDTAFNALRRMFIIQMETNMDLSGKARYGKARQKKLAGMLNRLGCPV